MLGFIRGKIISRTDDTSQCVVLAHRVGYEITLPKRLYDELVCASDAKLWLHTHVREDVLALYGFAEEVDRQFFRMLLSVSGLGPRTALSLIGQHGAAHLVRLIMEKKTSEIATAPGVGKKIADRLVLELGKKVMKLVFPRQSKLDTQSAIDGGPQKSLLRDDLASALSNLGYPAGQVQNMLGELFAEEGFDGMSFEHALKRALRELST
jgi:Holliday junction DNA helicase RuvA